MHKTHHGIALLALAAFFAAVAVPALSAAEPQPANSLVNINSADSLQLQKLPRVGPKVAERIIEYRRANGAFKRIQDLMKIKGIGERTFERLKNLITV